jgi:hypothetical protein
MTISGNNVALLTDCILAAFRGSDVMVHRDMRGVSERFSASRRLSRGRSSRPQAPALTIAERARSTTALPDTERSQREEAGRSPSPVGLRQPILNLGMLLSTKCNVRINLRSMVRRIFLITLAGWPSDSRATWNCHKGKPRHKGKPWRPFDPVTSCWLRGQVRRQQVSHSIDLVALDVARRRRCPE